MSGNIEYWRSQLHKADEECRRLKARAEKAEAERDEAEQYANKANAALMETIARAEKAEAENQAIKAIVLHGEARLCTKAEWEAKYGDND